MMISNVNSVKIPIGPVYDNAKNRRNVNFTRRWRSLTSLQKYGLLLGTIILICIFMYAYYSTSPRIKELSSDTRHRPHGMPKEVKERLLAAKSQTNLQLMKNNEHIIPRRGPPRARIAHPANNPTLAVTNNIQPGKIVDQVKQHGRIAEPDKARDPSLINHTPRQKVVIDAFRHAWKGYKDHAWGHDELRPIQKGYSEWFYLGLTIIDSLDTMWLMNLKQEFLEAKDWVKTMLSFDSPVNVNLFETTIRVLGGLLSTYHLSGDEMFLKKANDLGDRLLGAFTSVSGIPFSDVNLRSRIGKPPSWSPDSSLSEVTTIQLEFKDLFKSTGGKQYFDKTDKVMEKVFSLHRPAGLAPIHIDPQSGQFRNGDTITLGARGDSYYEYLLKQWIQSGKTDQRFMDKYLEAVAGIQKLLVRQSSPHKLTYVGELLQGRTFSPKMDHLVCFLPGTLALGYYNGLPKEHMDLAKRLIETCYAMYEEMPTGLSPEIVYFNMDPRDLQAKDIQVHALDRHNLLRPETVESLYIMYRITKDKKYQEYGWKIFQAFEKYTKIEGGGYSSINNVMNPGNPQFRDKMESFFLGETLKYLFLLFTDEDIVPLDKFVFNTEAHPLPIWTGGKNDGIHL